MLIGFGCLKVHVINDPSACEDIICLPSKCHAADRNASVDCHLHSAILVRKSHSANCPLSYPINIYTEESKVTFQKLSKFVFDIMKKGVQS